MQEDKINSVADVQAIEAEIKKINEAIVSVKTNLINLKDEVISINASVKNLNSLPEIEASIKKLNTATEQRNSLNKENAALQKQLISAQEKLTKAQSEEGKQLASVNLQIQKQNKLNKDLARESLASANSIEKQRARVAQLKNEWANADLGTKKFKQLEKDLRNSTKELESFENRAGIFSRGVGSYAKNIISSFVRMGAAIFSVGAAINLFKNATKTIADFEQANANLATILGKSRDQITDLTNSAKQLGATTEWMASQVTELQTELAKLGFTEQQIMNMQASILQFSTAIGANLSDAAALAGATLRAFGLESQEMERVVGAMTVGANKSALSFGYLNTAMSTISPVAKSFGFTVEDTVALLGTLADSGFDAGTAATATRNILLNLADSSGKLAKQLGKPVKSLDELSKGLKELRSRGIDLNTTLELTDKRSVAAFNTFLDGADKLLELRDAVSDTDGELKRIQEERLNTVEGSVKLLNSAWEGLMLSFSNSTGPMKTVINGLTALINTYNEFITALERKKTGADVFDVALAGRRAYIETVLAEQKDLNEKFAKGLTEDQMLENAIEESNKMFQNRAKELSDALEMSKKDLDRWTQEEIDLGLKGAIRDLDDFNTRQKELDLYLSTSSAAITEYRAKLEKPIEIATSSGGGTLSKEELDKRLNAELKAIQKNEELKVELIADAEGKALEKSRLSYEKQKTEIEKQLTDKANLTPKATEALNESLENLERVHQINLAKIRNEYNDKRIKEADDAAKERLAAEKRRSTEAIKLAQKEMEELKEARAADMSDELLQLAEQYQKGKISKEQYEQEKMNIQWKYTKLSIEDEINALQTLLDENKVKGDARIDIEKKLAEAKNELQEKSTDNTIKNLEKETEARKKAAEKAKEYAKQAFDIYMDFITQRQDARISEIDAELEKLQEWKDRELERLDESVMSEETRAAETKRINEEAERQRKELEKKKKEEEYKQFIADQTKAIANVAINTAVEISKVLATPWMIPIISALGAAQVALIASQKFPSYWAGTDNHPGGLAIVGDTQSGIGGKTEYIQTPTGQIYETPKMPTLVSLEAGSKVFPSYSDMVKRLNINIPKLEKNEQLDFDKGIKRLEDTIRQNKAVQSVNLDSKGIWVVSNGCNNRVRILSKLANGD